MVGETMRSGAALVLHGGEPTFADWQRGLGWIVVFDVGVQVSESSALINSNWDADKSPNDPGGPKICQNPFHCAVVTPRSV